MIRVRGRRRLRRNLRLLCGHQRDLRIDEGIVDPNVVEFLVGHTLSIVAVCTDPDSLPLAEAVALVLEVPERLYRDDDGEIAEVVRLHVG